MSSAHSPDHSIFSKERHVKYWLRCLKTYLPNQYTSNDSNRMTLAFFTLSALDLLGVLHETTTSLERSWYTDWIYLCQHPSGGFRGFTGTNFGAELRSDGNEHWDPANLAGTFFALVALAVLGDDLERVKGRECLTWLAKLQSEDGSFGEVLGRQGKIEGGRDVRFCYLAAVVRWIVRGSRGDLQDVEDISVDSLATFVKASKTYDGGIAKAPFHEAHAGWTYCGIGTLSVLGKLPPLGNNLSSPQQPVSSDGKFVQEILQWLVYRQTTTLTEEEPSFEVFGHTLSNDPHATHSAPPTEHHAPPLEPGLVLDEHQSPPANHLDSAPGLYPQGVSVFTPSPVHTPMPLPTDTEELLWIGVNGRCNKFADTCYCFWVGGTLGILKKIHLICFNGIRRYLLEKTQHIVGGFGKLPGDPPDILHSYLGLAALAAMKEPGLKSLDPTLCISVSAYEHLESLPWRRKESMEKEVAYMAISGG